jgi:hypothetical protein
VALDRDDHGLAGGAPLDRADELGLDLLAPVEHEVFLGRKVVEYRLVRDVGRRRDLGDRHRLEAALGEELDGQLRQQPAGRPLLALA